MVKETSKLFKIHPSTFRGWRDQELRIRSVRSNMTKKIKHLSKGYFSDVDDLVNAKFIEARLVHKHVQFADLM